MRCACGLLTRSNCAVKTRRDRILRPKATAEHWLLFLGDAAYKDRHYCYLTLIEAFVVVIEAIILTTDRPVLSSF